MKCRAHTSPDLDYRLKIDMNNRLRDLRYSKKISPKLVSLGQFVDCEQLK